MLNKIVGINYQITRKQTAKSLDNLEQVEKMRRKCYSISDHEVPDKDKLFNQLTHIHVWNAIWNLLILAYIKVIYKFTYKCEYYCMSESAKIERNLYLKKSHQYTRTMPATELFQMSKDDLDLLIAKLTNYINAVNPNQEDRIFFDKHGAYVIYDTVRYNLWDTIQIQDTLGTKKFKTLADATIILCKIDYTNPNKMISCGTNIDNTRDKSLADQDTVNINISADWGYTGHNQFV